MSIGWKWLRHAASLASLTLVAWWAAVACSPETNLGALGSCAQDQDCAAGRCSNERVCVACVLDGDCASGQHCAHGECRASVTCVSNTECEAAPGEPICSQRGVCVECVGAADCGGGPCDGGQCLAVNHCAQDADCPGRQVCPAELGYCVACVSGADCAEGEACHDQRCVARCSSDDDCSPGLLCDPSRKLCLDCRVDADCPSAYHCSRGRCSKDVCGPGTTGCLDTRDATYQCSEDGRALVPVFCPQKTTCTAPPGDKAECADWACEPGASECTGEGEAVRVCDADGLGWGEPADCAAQGGICHNGSCLDVVCTAGQRQCMANAVFTCNGLGTALSLFSNCSSSQFCNADTAACESKVCVADAAICDGEVATTCRPDGSGPVAGGTDCAAAGKACHAGECKDVVCSGGFVCEGKTRYACLDNGTRLFLSQVCPNHQYCDPNYAWCLNQVCTPGATYCSSNAVSTCNAEGSGPEPGGTPCGADKVCVSSTCLDKVCEPNSYFCQGNTVMRCGTDGTTSSVWSSCSTSQWCEEGASVCRAQVCTPDAPTCSGSQLSTCASNGSGPIDAGEACPEGQTCASHSCRDVICEAGIRYCRDGAGGNVYTCNATGTASSLQSTCTAATQHCDHSGVHASCQLDVCVASTAGCLGEALATCNAAGSGFVDPTVDCSATSQLCTAAGCADMDVFAAANPTTAASASSTVLYLHRYDVTTSRRLGEIEAYLAIAGTVQLQWVVYECIGGTCTRQYSKLTQGTGTGYLSSGEVTGVVLEAGKMYAVGVRVVGSHTRYTSSFPVPQSASFGLWRGTASPSAATDSPLVVYPSWSWSATPAHRVTTLPVP